MLSSTGWRARTSRRSRVVYLMSRISPMSLLTLVSPFVLLATFADLSFSAVQQESQPSTTRTEESRALEALEGYVGADTCVACHDAIHTTWDNSRHSKMVQPATVKGVKGDFSAGRLELRGEPYEVEAKDGQFFITESRLTGKKTRRRVLYTLGNRRIQHYLAMLDDGRVVVLPPAWDVLRGEWFHQMEIVGPDPEQGAAVQVWNKNCFGCHVSQQRRNFDIQTKTYDTDWVDFGISCERCHGPAREHVGKYVDMEGSPLPAAGRPVADSSIVVQTRLDNVTNSYVCAQCHSLRSEIAPGFRAGADYFDHFIPELEYAMVPSDDPPWYVDGKTRRFSSNALGIWQSRCFLEGKAACTNCHNDMHDPEIEKATQLAASNNALCTGCHESIAVDLGAHTHHPPESRGSSCVECHMPRSVVSIKATMRDHSISIPAPENTDRYDIPNACNLCHEDESPSWAVETLNEWFPGSHAREKLIRRADAFAGARARDPLAIEKLIPLAGDPTEPPLIRANAVGYLGQYTADPRSIPALLRALGSEEPVIRAIAAPQLARVHPDRLASLRPMLVQALGDQLRAVRIGAAFSLVSLGVTELPGDVGARFEQAKQEYVLRAMGSPDHAPTQLELGKFHIQNRDLPAAAIAFETSVRLDPDQQGAHYFRGLARLGEGKTDEARSELKRVPRSDDYYESARALLRTLSSRN